MTDMKTFEELFEEHSTDLELYVPVVAKVHGTDHPEFLKVKEAYDGMIKKLEDADLTNIDRDLLKNEFAALREITDGYKVPEDTCETYFAVYNILAKLDEVY